MVDFVRDPDKFQIERSEASEVQKIFLYYKQKQTISGFTD